MLEGGKCTVHNVAPAVCKLFPFLAVGKNQLCKGYPFCLPLQGKGLEGVKGEIDEGQRARVKEYFDSVERNGFGSNWKSLPKSAVVLLEGEKELRISKKEFLQLIAPLL